MTTIIVDDLDGTEIRPDTATTVAWSWRGVHYEFDTTPDRLAALESDADTITVAQLLAISRRVSGRRDAIRPVVSAETDPATSSAIRAWARDNGIAVPDRGRIPAPIRNSYLAARGHRY